MKFYVLASGSQGNSTFIDFNGVGVLIDCGISKRQLTKCMNECGYELNQIDYVLLTHDHSDHKKTFIFLIQVKSMPLKDVWIV